MIDHLSAKFSLSAVRTSEDERKHYQSYVEILKLLNQQKSKHWGLEAIKITLSHFLLKFMKPVDWQEMEDGFLNSLENTHLSSMKTLLARGIFKLTSFRAEMHSE